MMDMWLKENWKLTRYIKGEISKEAIHLGCNSEHSFHSSILEFQPELPHLWQ